MLAPLYEKSEVISCLGIKPSEFKEKRSNGIIPPPVGRKGNRHLWKSTTISAIAISLRANGNMHSKQNTLDIMLKDLITFEQN